MEIYYVDREYQGPETENPLLINGEHKTWKMDWISHHGDNFSRDRESPDYKCTLQGWIESIRLKRPYTKTIFIHDVRAVEGIFCDQGCKIGHGCRKGYKLNNFILLINYAFEIDEEAREAFRKT